MTATAVSPVRAFAIPVAELSQMSHGGANARAARHSFIIASVARSAERPEQHFADDDGSLAFPSNSIVKGVPAFLINSEMTNYPLQKLLVRDDSFSIPFPIFGN